MAGKFYVYQLIDPRNDRVFYVGKGQGERINAHERQARGPGNSHKCNVIRAIWGEGLEVGREIVQRFAMESAAYEFEARLIEENGLENLTNVLPGGVPKERTHTPKVAWAWTMREVRKISGSVARSLQQMAIGRIHIGDHDVNDAVVGLISRMVDDLGSDQFADLVRPHGIEVSYG